MCLGIPARVVEVAPGDFPSATVEVGGVRRVVHTGLVADDGGVAPGDWVLIHVGFALARMDEDEAVRALAYLQALGSDEEFEPLASLEA